MRLFLTFKNELPKSANKLWSLLLSLGCFSCAKWEEIPVSRNSLYVDALVAQAYGSRSRVSCEHIGGESGGLQSHSPRLLFSGILNSHQVHATRNKKDVEAALAAELEGFSMKDVFPAPRELLGMHALSLERAQHRLTEHGGEPN